MTGAELVLIAPRSELLRTRTDRLVRDLIFEDVFGLYFVEIVFGEKFRWTNEHQIGEEFEKRALQTELVLFDHLFVVLQLIQHFGVEIELVHICNQTVHLIIRQIGGRIHEHSQRIDVLVFRFLRLF